MGVGTSARPRAICACAASVRKRESVMYFIAVGWRTVRGKWTRGKPFL